TAAMAVVSLDAPPAAAAGGHESDTPGRRPETESAQRRAAAHPSQTDVTLFNLGDAARAAVEAARKIEDERAAAAAGAAAAEEAPRKAAVDEAARRAVARQQRPFFGWPQVARGVMVAGGVVLLALFALDSPIIPALAGLQLALSIYYFVGGIVLASGALLP